MVVVAPDVVVVVAADVVVVVAAAVVVVVQLVTDNEGAANVPD